MDINTRADFLRLGAGSISVALLAGCSPAVGLATLPGAGSTSRQRQAMSSTVNNNVVTTTQNGMTMTTDLSTGLMTFSGFGVSQTYQTPASGSVPIGQTSTFPDGTTYIASSNTTASFSKGSSSGSVTFSSDGTNYTSSVHQVRYSAIDYASGDTGRYGSAPRSGGGGTLPPQVGSPRSMHPMRGGWGCGWSVFELGLAATGLGIGVGALIAATGGIGAAAVVGIVAAHMSMLASLVDVAMNCM